MKIFVLGLDGATFDLIDPMVKEGILPNIASIYQTGARSQLQTIFPPVTGPAWLALASGLNPGKTGVFDYVNRRAPETNDLIPLSSAYYSDVAMWDILGAKGYKVGVFNYPGLSPTPKVNGFSVSGIGAYKDEALTHPSSLEPELQDITGGYEINLNLKSAKYRRNIHLFIHDVNRVIFKQWKTLKYLITTKEWDFFFGAFHFTDWVQHLLWHHLDPLHPLHDPGSAPSVQHKFKEIWKRIDVIIGELLSLIGDATLFIISDHGFGPLDSAFYPNTWLEEQGWLKRKATDWRALGSKLILPLSENFDNRYLNAVLRRIRSRVLNNPNTMDRIDLDQSLAYSPEHAGMFGCINLTDRGRQTPGFLEKMTMELQRLAGRIRGLERIDIMAPDDLYSGPYVKLAPDLLFVVNEYRSSVEINFARASYVDRPSQPLRTGGHRSNGIFMAAGKHVIPTSLELASVLDLAPTVLAMYNIPLPAALDGRVLVDCLDPEFVESLNIRHLDADATRSEPVEEKGNLDEMRKTLEALGYM
jgi:predicted AlkP superfamily phosphohydrolase/phosphomutase